MTMRPANEFEDIDDIYREALLELNRNPLNRTQLQDFDIKQREVNPLCGDDIEVFLKFDEKGKVAEVGHWGDGCAISQASASLLTDFVKGKTSGEIGEITREQVLDLLGLPNLNPTRQRCALLTLRALQRGINGM